MKEKMKKSLLGLVLTVCMVLLSAMPVLAAKDLKLTEEQITSFKSGAAQLIEQIAGFSDEEIENYLDQDNDFTNSALTSWKNAKGTLGAFKEVGEQEVSVDGRSVTIVSKVTYENKTATVELIADTKASSYESMAFNIDYTMGEKMEQAAMNTVMGVGIVFLMLLFLSFIIGLFKHIGKLEAKVSKKQEVSAPVKEIPVPDFEEAEEEELSDDAELVAVIAAAVAAYEGSEGTDGFVVRSIKKSNGNKWKRA